uniref:Uncharacterized protein n=1 Tax=Anguilla anguilla TaxID=7936 RepID=A0A0E9RAW7_ANGAN
MHQENIKGLHLYTFIHAAM